MNTHEMLIKYREKALGGAVCVQKKRSTAASTRLLLIMIQKYMKFIE